MVNNLKNSLWVEKHRPNSLDGYVGNNHIIQKVKSFIENNDVPHLLFHGKPGTGKTTLSKIIINEIECDELNINASSENSVDVVRDKIKMFASTKGFQKWKIVFLDECDYLTPNAQASLRNMMETFSTSTRFILTCNYLEKIIEPIQSRCQTFEIIPPSKEEVRERVEGILGDEKIDFEQNDLSIIIDNFYPDIRKTIGSIQQQVIENKLVIDESSFETNYMIEILKQLKTMNSAIGIFPIVRKFIINSKVKDFTPLYRFLYDNVDEFNYDNGVGARRGDVGKVIQIISNYQYQDAFVVDKEINVVSMLWEICEEIKTDGRMRKPEK